MAVENAVKLCRETGADGFVSAAFMRRIADQNSGCSTGDSLDSPPQADSGLRTKTKYGGAKNKQGHRWDPEHCPCKKKSCARYKKCDECREYHCAKNSPPYCER